MKFERFRKHTVALVEALGNGYPATHGRTSRGSRQWVSFCKLPHYKRQWVLGLLQYIAALMGTVGSGYPSIHHHIIGGTGWWVSTARQYTKGDPLLVPTAVRWCTEGCTLPTAPYSAALSCRIPLPTAHCSVVAY